MIFFFISTQNYFISTCTIWQCNGFSPNINIADINNLFPIYLYTLALLMLSSYDTVIYNWWFAGCPLMPSPLGEQYFRMQVGIMGLIDFACPVQQKYVYEKCMCSYWNVQVCMSSLFTCRIFYWLKLSHVLAFLKYIFEENYYNKKIDYICSF